MGDSGTVLSEEQKALTIRILEEARGNLYLELHNLKEKEARVAEIEGIIGAFGSPLEQITLVTPNVSEFDSKSSFDV